MSAKQDKVCQIIAVCVKNNKDPYNTNAFADFIFRICAQLFAFDRRACKPYVDTIILAWRHDKWRRYVENNQYLSKGEISAWMIIH